MRDEMSYRRFILILIYILFFHSALLRAAPGRNEKRWPGRKSLSIHFCFTALRAYPQRH